MSLSEKYVALSANKTNFKEQRLFCELGQNPFEPIYPHY
jgi:hypothetical protein